MTPCVEDADFIYRRRLDLELERRKLGGDCGCFVANGTDGPRIDAGCCTRHRPDAPAVAVASFGWGQMFVQANSAETSCCPMHAFSTWRDENNLRACIVEDCRWSDPPGLAFDTQTQTVVAALRQHIAEITSPGGWAD